MPDDRFCKCGSLRNRYIDGVLQLRCTSCADKRALMRPTRAAGHSTIGAASGDAKNLLAKIADMLNDPDNRYEFASGTLEGIQITVKANGQCTERQQLAVDNIEDSVERQSQRERR